MMLETALVHLRSGYAIRRRSWPKGKFIKFGILIKYGDGKQFRMSGQDVNAEDWMLYYREDKFYLGDILADWDEICMEYRNPVIYREGYDDKYYLSKDDTLMSIVNVNAPLITIRNEFDIVISKDIFTEQEWMVKDDDD